MKIFGQHEEQTIIQLQKVAQTAERVALMADGHVGYVMPIGGVAAYRDKVSVVGVGFDIACGNAAIRTDLTLADLGQTDAEQRGALGSIADEIARTVSFGIGRKNRADDAPIDHALFRDDAWDAAPPRERKALVDKARASSSAPSGAAITTWTSSPTRRERSGSACTSAAAASATRSRPASSR